MIEFLEFPLPYVGMKRLKISDWKEEKLETLNDCSVNLGHQTEKQFGNFREDKSL